MCDWTSRRTQYSATSKALTHSQSRRSLWQVRVCVYTRYVFSFAYFTTAILLVIKHCRDCSMYSYIQPCLFIVYHLLHGQLDQSLIHTLYVILYHSINTGMARVHDGVGEQALAVEQYKTLLAIDRYVVIIIIVLIPNILSNNTIWMIKLI